MTRFANKVAFVTGGSRGIGAAIVKRLADEGASVAFTYAGSKDKADALAATFGKRALAIQADAKDAAAVKAAIDKAQAHFGGLDILVNNAGIAIFKPINEMTLEDFDAISAVNVRGVYAAIIAAVPHLKAGGRIINISSCNAEKMPFEGGGLYAMSKSALRGLVQGFARDLGPKGITINNVQPGPVNTDMNPDNGPMVEMMHSTMAIKRHGKPEEIAAMVAYLASEEAAFVTGAHLTIDGGFNV